MRIYDIIAKKRDGCRLARDEIEHFVKGSVSGEVADYQITALLMAMYINGMSPEETFYLTDAMMKSGDTADLSCIHGIKTDKHSTGGVGDKVTLVLAPLVAACGLKMVKLSGRGLGFTGGTVDKLKSVPGMRMDLDEKEVYEIAERVGAVVVNKAGNFAPADKIMYVLRDVTATVDSIPLICGSIMSKKLASGADTILLDVKYGSGAFMPTKESALQLAEKMVEIGTRAGKNIGALITDMEQPLSDHVGNSLEVIGIIEVLKGKQNRLYNEIKEVAVKLLTLSGKYSEEEAEKAFCFVVESGAALRKLAEMVHAQHGDESYILHPEKFVLGSKYEVVAEKDGFVDKMNAANIGRAVTLLGGGRMKKEDKIDFSVGVVMSVCLGSAVKKGDVLCTVYHNGKGLDEAVEMLKQSIHIGDKAPSAHKIAYAYVSKNGVQLY